MLLTAGDGFATESVSNNWRIIGKIVIESGKITN